MIEATSQINLQIQTRQIEKERYHQPQNYQYQPRRHQANTSQRRTQDRDKDTIIQINAAITKKEKDKLIKKKACFNCRIPGHFTNKCRKPRKSQGTANQGTQQIATAIHIYTPDESSTEEMSETDDELPDKYKTEKVQQQAKKQKQLQKEIQQALEEPIETDSNIAKATQ
jgi:hypothetical protein